MKKYILLLLSFLSLICAHASDSAGKISYFPVETGVEIPDAARKLIVSKMDRILTQNGYGALERGCRFVMLAKCNVLQKDVAPTTPPRISQKVEITFILGDAIENKTYASATVELSGIGVNETKAWQTAVNSIKPANPVFKKMLEDASVKIEAYYAEQCERMIAESRTLASTGNYDEAIATLMSMPDVCSDCHKDAMNAVAEIYQKMLDSEGAALLAKARSAWAASPGRDGADIAISYIIDIPVSSSAFADAEKFAASIAEKLSSEKEREWALKLRQYDEEVEYRKRDQANSHAQSMAAIAAARSVAEKWDENQPQTKVYLNW